MKQQENPVHIEESSVFKNKTRHEVFPSKMEMFFLTFLNENVFFIFILK